MCIKASVKRYMHTNKKKRVILRNQSQDAEILPTICSLNVMTNSLHRIEPKGRPVFILQAEIIPDKNN